MTEPPGAIFRERTTSRVFDAPRDAVWRAWTEPDQLAVWWGPKGMSVPPSSVELNLQPGGVFRLTMVADATGAEFPSEMRYREVAPPERLVYEWDAQRGIGSGVVTVTFNDLGDRTEVITHFAGFATDEIFTGSERAWQTSLDKLDGQLASSGNQP